MGNIVSFLLFQQNIDIPDYLYSRVLLFCLYFSFMSIPSAVEMGLLVGGTYFYMLIHKLKNIEKGSHSTRDGRENLWRSCHENRINNLGEFGSSLRKGMSVLLIV